LTGALGVVALYVLYVFTDNLVAAWMLAALGALDLLIALVAWLRRDES
jgi:hypothetical protein